MNNDEFSKLAHSRRSTRDFRPERVPGSDIDAILADGMSAPSWSNTRPFMVAVARDEQRDRISRALVARLRENAEAPGMGMNPDYTHEIPYPPGLIERSQRVGKGIYDTLGIDRADKESRFRFMERNYEFFGAPVALFMEAAMLSAKSRGLGTCAQGYLGNYPDIIKKEFEVPEEYALVCGMSLGYPSEHPINSWEAERLPMDELLAQPMESDQN
jgi:nitroreductase